MIIWSDDCGDCLCNLPHSLEKHNQAVAQAHEEMQEELAQLRELNRDIEHEDEEKEEELTPDELENLIAYLRDCNAIIEQQLANGLGIPILDEYCWDREHTGGWSCRECFEHVQKNTAEERGKQQ